MFENPTIAKNSLPSPSSAVPLKQELKTLEEKQMRLLDAYREQTITNEEYTKAKKKFSIAK